MALDLPPAPWDQVTPSHSEVPAVSPGLASLVASLSTQRKSRELGLRLRSNLRLAAAEYSHLRKQGYQELAAFLEAILGAEDMKALFCESQLYPELQIVPVLYAHSLAPPKEASSAGGDPLGGEPPQGLRQPSSEEEVVSALRLLEGCCVLDPSSRSLAARHGIAKNLLERLEQGSSSSQLQAACLDALLATLVDCPPSLQVFDALNGVAHVCRKIKNRQCTLHTRLKCAEFLQLLMDQVLQGSDLPLRREAALQTAASLLGSPAVALLRSGALGPGGIPTSGSLRTRAQHILDSVKF